VKMGAEIIGSPGSERRLSRTVGTHVANAITKWMEHLPYLRDRSADQVRTGNNCRRSGAMSQIGRRKSVASNHTRPDGQGRSGDYFALAMNYSAVANHTVNLTVHVYNQVPVSSLNEHKNKNCNSPAHQTAWRGPCDRRREEEVWPL
jgi:hypothetical protein